MHLLQGGQGPQSFRENALVNATWKSSWVLVSSRRAPLCLYSLFLAPGTLGSLLGSWPAAHTSGLPLAPHASGLFFASWLMSLWALARLSSISGILSPLRGGSWCLLLVCVVLILASSLSRGCSCLRCGCWWCPPVTNPNCQILGMHFCYILRYVKMLTELIFINFSMTAKYLHPTSGMLITGPVIGMRSCCVFSHSVVSDSVWPHGCSPPGSSVRGILQARSLERAAMPSPRGSSPPRDRNYTSCVSCIASGLFTCWTINAL